MTQQQKLTPEQLEIVELDLAEAFVNEQDDIAADLGIERQPDGEGARKTPSASLTRAIGSSAS